MIEAALADVGHPSAALSAARTDAFAEGRPPPDAPLPETVEVSVPEGFAYYALDPSSYGEATQSLSFGLGDRVLVVGIRSIGTTLSAVVRAALRGHGAERITVRPNGHPYDRHLAVTIDPATWSDVIVVDEGPGLSGSTFLATAEAIERSGFPRARIVMITSHDVDPDRLCAPDAGARWRRFRSIVAPSRGLDGEDVSAGAWRSRRGIDAPVFAAAERRKVLRDGRLWKFEGLGATGIDARARAERLARAGWIPEMRDEGDGWMSTPWFEGVGSVDVETLARYCAERPHLCPARVAAVDLRPMVEKNAGIRLDDLPIIRPCIADARMAPHEWIGTRKVDAIADGDGHFFPGPTDIAWDLAGAIVEHELDRDDRAAFLSAYRRFSGDDARDRIDAWLVAYRAFTRAWSLFCS